MADHDAGREAGRAAAPPADESLRGIVRWLRHHGVSRARRAYASLGLALTVALAVAAAALWGFVALADEVADGETLAVDQAILRWVGAHQTGWLDAVAVEVTALGSSVVVVATALVAAGFLAALRRRSDVLTLLTALIGSLVLNGVLKAAYGRTRPDVFEWLVTRVGDSSFPSGHSLHATVLFATLAFVLLRLDPARWLRRSIVSAALLGVLLVAWSRVYLGVHYPTDVVAGVAVGYAWATACALGGRIFEAVRPQRER